MKYAIVDIETTGGHPKIGRIIDIAIFIHDGQNIIDSYDTLVNPQEKIPPFIAGLTGIQDNDVSSAPLFAEVADKIDSITEGAVFVAHNVDFDYESLCNEFLRLKREYKRKAICSVKLAKAVFPHQTSYSLGKICAEMGIPIKGRHSARGDAEATVSLFKRILDKISDNPIDVFDQLEATQKEIKKSGRSISGKLDKRILKNLSSGTGVYYFFNQERDILYIGKSKNIKSRVFNHLKNMDTENSISLKNQITHVSYIETGSELVAELKHYAEVIKHNPPFNSEISAPTIPLFGLVEFKDKSGYLNLRVERNKEEAPSITFDNFAQANSKLFSIAHQNNLCLKLLGLYKKKGACPGVEKGHCFGACVNKEETVTYNQRTQNAVDTFNFRYENFVVFEKGRHEKELAMVLIKNNFFVGFGYFNSGKVPQHQLHYSDLAPFLLNNEPTPVKANKIVKNYLSKRKKRVHSILPFIDNASA